jgi:uncharacterized protein (DUF58 family)
MLWTIARLLLVLWGVGTVTSYTMGGFVHLLLVFALATVLLRLVHSRRDHSWPLAERARVPK